MGRGEKKVLSVPVHVLEQNWFQPHLHFSEAKSQSADTDTSPGHLSHLPPWQAQPPSWEVHSPQQIFERQTGWLKH